MVCFGDRFDTFLGSCLMKLKNGVISSDERQSFSLPGAEPRYAPDRTVDVTHILLDLTLDIEERRMDGICTLSFTVISGESSTVELDAAEMEIRQVEDPDGNPLDFEHIGEKLKIFPIEPYDKGESSSLSIHYLVQEPRLGLYFVLPDEEYPDRPVQAWTQGQDNDSRYWFPCFDYPNEKATSETIITVDERFFALSNGKLLETAHDTSSGTRTYHWKQSIPHVSYLISIVAGEFVEHAGEYDGIPVSYYVPPGREEDGERAFGKTPDMIRFFSEKLEFPYPYEKYAQIAVEDFVFGGMENTTATTQTARTLHDERAHLDYESEPLVAHELAHQWFGNLVTCKDWSHAWLNEGFATYLEAL